MKWVCFPKFYSPLANWPLLKISPQSSLYVIYCLILTAWQWLMSFTCIPVQNEPNKSPLRKRLLVILLWEIGHLSSPSRSCLGRFIFICSRRQALWAKLPHSFQWFFLTLKFLLVIEGSPNGSHRLEWNNLLYQIQCILLFPE